MPPHPRDFVIRTARPDEHDALGQLMVAVYAGLAGFPSPDQQPRYYQLLAGIGRLAGQPDTQLLVAARADRLLGGVVYVADMARYGAGGTASQERHASGFRLLAVAADARGLGVGRALAQHCLDLAREHDHWQVIIHTTAAMQIAWGMYERLGFARAPELDFDQDGLPVFGFRLPLATTRGPAHGDGGTGSGSGSGAGAAGHTSSLSAQQSPYCSHTSSQKQEAPLTGSNTPLPQLPTHDSSTGSGGGAGSTQPSSPASSRPQVRPSTEQSVLSGR